MRKIGWILPVMVIVLAMLACNLPARAKPVLTDKGAITPAVEETVTPGETAQSGGQETITPSATPGNEQNAEFNGLKFSYGPGVASGIKPQIAPLEENDPNATGWPGPVPEHFQVDFSGYPFAGGSHAPQLFLYPVKEYAAGNAPAGDIAKKLDDILRSSKPGSKGLPFLPMWNASQVFASQVQILPFQNGRGLRYISCYSQAVLPIDQDCLFYTYQGLTADGKYYLSMVFPLKLAQLDTPELKALFDASKSDGTKYAAYFEKVTGIIDAAQGADFQPALEDLDAVAQSVVALPTVTLKGLEVKAVSCPGAMAPRLKKDMHIRVTITDGTPLRLRASAGKSAKVKELIQEGATMVVTGDAACQDSGLWWPVTVDATKSAGWVLEGENGVYLVEPWNQ